MTMDTPVTDHVLGVRPSLDALSLRLKIGALSAAVKVGRPAVFALRVSKNERRVLAAEYGADAFALSGRIRKTDKVPTRVDPATAAQINQSIASFRNAGGEVIIKGYPDRGWGLDIPSGPGLTRMEASIFGTRPSRLDAETVAYVVDRNGLYFDGRVVTDLEKCLDETEPGFWQADSTLQSFFKGVSSRNIQKYSEFQGRLTCTPPADAVLVVGQVSRDAAVAETITLARTNFELAAFARTSFPNRPLYYKAHPIEKNAEAEAEIAKTFGCRIVNDDVSFNALTHQFKTMVMMTSGAGLEAALRGVEVHLTGVSFYSHRGFTVDHVALPPTRRKNQLAAIDVYAAFLARYAKYARVGVDAPRERQSLTFAEFLLETGHL